MKEIKLDPAWKNFIGKKFGKKFPTIDVREGDPEWALKLLGWDKKWKKKQVKK